MESERDVPLPEASGSGPPGREPLPPLTGGPCAPAKVFTGRWAESCPSEDRRPPEVWLPVGENVWKCDEPPPPVVVDPLPPPAWGLSLDELLFP
jgi:hypothetical protein